MKRIILIVVVLKFVGQADAENFKYPAHPKATGYIKLEGKIAKVNYEKLKNLLRKPALYYVFGIHFALLGGDFFEGMKIGLLIRRLKLRTETTT